MAIGIDQFTPESFAQANPQFSAIQATQSAIQNAVQTAYTQPLLQQKLQAAQLQNIITGAQAGQAPAQQLAATQLAQARIPNMAAQTQAQLGAAAASRGAAASSYATAGLTSQQRAVLAGQTPYMINKAKFQQYTDPFLQRNIELQSQLQNPQTRQALIASGIVTPQQAAAYTGTSPQGSINPSNAPMITGTMQGAPNLQPVVGQNTGQIQPALQPTSGVAPGITGAPNMYTGNSLQNYMATGNPWGPQAMAQMQATGKATGSTNVSLYNTLQQKASERAIQASQMLNNLNQFSTNYDKSSLTGPIEGNLPASGFGSGISSALKGGSSLTPEQLTDNASKQLAVSVVKGLFPKATNQELASVTAMKPSRTMAHGAKQVAVGSLNALGQRDQQETQFYAQAKNEGIPPQTAQTLWAKYFSETPWYNYQTNTPTPGTSADWQKYLTPQAVASLGNGQPINPASSTAAVQNTDQFNPAQSQARVRVISPQGRTGTVSAQNLQAAMNQGYREIG